MKKKKHAGKREIKGEEAPAPKGMVYCVIHGRRKELILKEDAESFDENERKLKECNNELQKARIRGTEDCSELEQGMSGLIDERENIIRRAEAETQVEAIIRERQVEAKKEFEGKEVVKAQAKE